MLKRALKFAIGPSVVLTIGNIPEILYKSRYNKMHPPILIQVGLCFIVGYIASFLVFLIIECIKKLKSNF